MKDLEIEEENDDNEQALIVNNPEIENILLTYLVVRPHSKNPNKICEVGLTGGLTKAFESRIMLANYILKTYGANWKNQVKLINDGGDPEPLKKWK